MTEQITLVTVVGVLLLIGQMAALYNSIVTAKKNATEPLNDIKRAVSAHSEEIKEIKRDMTDVKRDLNNAYDKIRENKEDAERTAKAQNAALVQILLILKEPTKKNDKAIDDTIKELTSI
jgi:chromosome segregation ATPase